MRNAVLILIIASFVLIAGSIDKTVTFSQNDLLLEKVNNHDVVELKGYPALIEPGKPRLPRVVQSLIVPSDAIPKKVEIISVHWIDIPGDYPVRYLPAEHRLQMATNITYRLTYDQSGNSGVMLRSNQQQVFSEILKGLV